MAPYSLITTVLAVILFVGVILLFRKLGLPKGKRILILVAALVAVFGIFMLLYYIPSFETPEDAFAYGYSGDILLLAEADQSAALLYRKDADATTTTLLFLKQREGRYRLGTASMREQVMEASTESGTVTVYRVKSTSDCFVFIRGVVSEEFTVTDSTGREFKTVFKKVAEDGYTVHALEAVDVSNDYTVYLGDLAVQVGQAAD